MLVQLVHKCLNLLLDSRHRDVSSGERTPRFASLHLLVEHRMLPDENRATDLGTRV